PFRTGVLALVFPQALDDRAVTRLFTALSQIIASHLSASRALLSCRRVPLEHQEEEIMANPEKRDATDNLSPAQQTLRHLWEEHVQYEFSTHNTEDTLAPMVEDAYVNHIPVLTGGVGREELREFYSKRFIPQMPPD